MLRLMLAAVALLGIGAAITAAAWQDEVNFEVEARGATFDVQGRIGYAPDVWEPGDQDLADGWAQSDDDGDITLSIDFGDLVPGDSRDFYVQLRNEGSVTAYLDVDASAAGWSGSPSCYGGSGAEVDTSDDYAEILEIEDDTTTSVFHLILDVPTGWSDDCQDAAGTWVLSLHYTTDEPVAP